MSKKRTLTAKQPGAVTLPDCLYIFLTCIVGPTQQSCLNNLVPTRPADSCIADFSKAEAKSRITFRHSIQPLKLQVRGKPTATIIARNRKTSGRTRYKSSPKSAQEKPWTEEHSTSFSDSERPALCRAARLSARSQPLHPWRQAPLQPQRPMVSPIYRRERSTGLGALTAASLSIPTCPTGTTGSWPVSILPALSPPSPTQVFNR